MADYGTNGGASVFPALDDPGSLERLSSSPARFYNNDGEAFKSVDPMGTVTCQEFDDAGRRSKLVENATSCGRLEQFQFIEQFVQQ